MSTIDTSLLSDAKPETYVPEKYVAGSDTPFPDTSKLIVDDGAPVDNLYTEKQQRLLVATLYSSWQPPDGKPFRASCNVGLFHAYKEPPNVPDAMVALNVPPSDGLQNSDNRSYFMWVIGKPPDIVIEIVSDSRGGEDTTKLKHYATIGVPYYIIFDPFGVLSDKPLRVFTREDGAYVQTKTTVLSKIGLGLTLWKGEIENEQGTWLRWCDAEGSLLLTADENTEQAKRETAKEKKRAEEAERKALAEKKRAEDSARETAAEKKLVAELEAKLKQLESQLKKST